MATAVTDGKGGSTRTNIALEVGPVTLPGYLDRPQIVTRKGRDEIEPAEFDLWPEPLKSSVSRTLGENLATLLRTDRVAIFPSRGPGSSCIRWS